MNQYASDLKQKYIEKGGGLPPVIPGLPDELKDVVDIAIMEQWLEGYQTAKKKFKTQYSAK